MKIKNIIYLAINKKNDLPNNLRITSQTRSVERRSSSIMQIQKELAIQ